MEEKELYSKKVLLFAKEGANVVGTGRHVEKVEKAFTAVLAAHQKAAHARLQRTLPFSLPQRTSV